MVAHPELDILDSLALAGVIRSLVALVPRWRLPVADPSAPGLLHHGELAHQLLVQAPNFSAGYILCRFVIVKHSWFWLNSSKRL